MTPHLKGKHRQRVAAAIAERFVRDRIGVHELAAELGRRPAVVRHLLEEAGLCIADVPCIGISDEDTAATLARRYSAGASIVELVRLTGIDKRIVRRLLIQAGVTLPQRHETTTQDAQQIVADYRAGASLRTLANSIGCSYGTVRAILLANEVQLRPRGAAAPVARSTAPDRVVCAYHPAGAPTDADRDAIATFAAFLRTVPRRLADAQAVS